jgi:hypothetical protein
MARGRATNDLSHGTVIRKCWLVALLVSDHLLYKDFWPYGIIFINVFYKCYYVNVVRGFWALWDI